MRFGALVATLLFTVGLLAQAAGDDAQVEQLSEQAKAAEARGDLAGAVEKYQSILKIDPRLGPAYNNLGALYVKAGEYAKAAAVLEKGLKVDPAMTSSSALLGISLFKIGKFAEARPRLEAALRASPANNELELLLVNDLTKLGAFEAAEGHLQQLSRREPENQQVLYLLGKVYTQLAQQALGKMNAIDPNSVWAHEISAEIMESMKNYEGAVVEYKKAVEIAPHQPGIHYKLGDLYWSLSQWDNASEQFKVELVNDPGNCMAQWKIGDVLLRQSIRPEQALSDVNKALEMCPNLSEARLDRGRLLLKLHKEADALPDLQAAVKANPTEPGVHFSLAQAYRAVGKPQEAQAEMKVFAKLDASARAKTAEQAEQAIQNQETAH
jgi:tetratricopeptide (TPR) repeat protein